MSTTIYEYKDYKKIIRLRLAELQKQNKSLTLKKIADLIPVQYTYLSKVMNSEDSHLNEDQLFTVCKTLDMGMEETEYISVLRSWQTAQNANRKTHLFAKLEGMRRQKKLNVEIRESAVNQQTNEFAFLLNPLAVILHVALSSEILRKDPLQLCSRLGISQKLLKQNLKILALNDLVVLDQDQLTITEFKQNKYHLDRSHPLMRVHQNQLKTYMLNRLNQTDEEQKQSFMATFTSNDEAFEEIKIEFNSFLKKAESIARKSLRPKDHQNVYHINFDFFRWL